MTTTDERGIIYNLHLSKEEGLKRLKEYFGQRLYRLAYGYLCCREDTQEAVQDILLKLWKNRKKVNYGKLEAYLFTIAKHHFFDLIKKPYRHEIPLESLNIEPAGGTRPDEIMDLKYIEKWLKQTLKEMKSVQRKLFDMRLKGFTYAEIGSQLGITEKAVERRVSRLINELKQRYESFSRS